jgi:hypothetical protein
MYRFPRTFSSVDGEVFSVPGFAPSLLRQGFAIISRHNGFAGTGSSTPAKECGKPANNLMRIGLSARHSRRVVRYPTHSIGNGE